MDCGWIIGRWRQRGYRHCAFTVMEMVVVLAIVAILVGMALAIGAKVRESSEVELTRAELSILSSELTRLEHRMGAVPPNMAAFLRDDQQLYLRSSPTGGWIVGRCAINDLPPAVLVRGVMPGPGGSSVIYVAAIKDGFGMPIQMVASPMQSPRAPFFFSSGPDKIINTPDDIFSYSP